MGVPGKMSLLRGRKEGQGENASVWTSRPQRRCSAALRVVGDGAMMAPVQV